jgi:hypothetical protein
MNPVSKMPLMPAKYDAKVDHYEFSRFSLAAERESTACLLR